MKKGRSLFAIVSLAVAASMLLSIPAFAREPADGKDPVVNRTPKEGFNDTVERVVETIDVDEANALYSSKGFAILLAPDGDQQSIIDLMGAELSSAKTISILQNKLANEIYARYELTNGGSIGLNEELGIVNVKNFKRSDNVTYEKTLDAVIETISKDLSLDGYTITESGLYQEQENYYRIAWQKAVEGSAKTNPFDSV